MTDIEYVVAVLINAVKSMIINAACAWMDFGHAVLLANGGSEPC